MNKKIEKSVMLSTQKEYLYKHFLDDEFVIQYMGCHIRKVNDKSYEWYQVKDDQETILLYGEIIHEEPYKYVTLSTFNPHRQYHHHYELKVTHHFETINNQTKFTIVQTGFESLPDGDQVYQENLMGWSYALNNIKKIFNKK